MIIEREGNDRPSVIESKINERPSVIDSRINDRTSVVESRINDRPSVIESRINDRTSVVESAVNERNSTHVTSNSIVESLKKILGDDQQPDEGIEVENYNTRRSSVQTRGVHAPASAASDALGIKSPLAEASRVEVDVYITVPFGTDTVHIKVASQITMLDPDGREFVFNFSVPS